MHFQVREEHFWLSILKPSKECQMACEELLILVKGAKSSFGLG